MDTVQAYHKTTNICRICFKHFKSSISLTRHEKSHNIKPRKCRQCPDKIFSTSSEYLTHLNELHHDRAVDYFICSECGKQFKTKSELTNHINSKCGTIKLYKCEVCDQKLKTPGSLYNHKLRHKGDPSYMCRFCAKLFLTAGQLKVHERIHTQEKAFICDICGKGFCHRQSLITHNSLHTGIKPYLCEGCGNSFSCVGNLLKHRKTHAECNLIPLTTHRIINPLTKMKVKVNTPASSKLRRVEKQRRIQKELEILESRKEEDTTNAEEDESSDTIKLGASVNEELEAAVIIKAENRNTPSENNKTQNDQSGNVNHNTGVIRKHTEKEDTCNFRTTQKQGSEEGKKCKCLKEYNDSVLKRHEKECYNELNSIYTIEDKKDNLIYQNHEPYSCNFCHKSFMNKKESEIHQIIVHANLLTCHNCNKTFLDLNLLQSHRNSFHRGMTSKTFICEYCGKQFKQKSVLNRHNINKCSDGPAIQCQVCGKKLSSVHVLKSHMKIHNGEKKLLCKFCGKSFHWKGQLKIHERTHTGEKPFTCLYCPKTFAYRESLITHSSLHTGIKPHLCEACGWRFSCIGNLIKHKTIYASTCGVWYNKIKNENKQNLI